MQIEVRHLHQRLGMTTVYVTHDQREALTMSDRVAVIDGGRFRQIDLPREIYERPQSRFIADFIGETYFLPVFINGGVPHFGDQQLATENALPKGIGPKGLLVVRPEKLHIATDGVAEAGANILKGRVLEAVYQGESVLVLVKLESGHEIAVRLQSSSQSEPPASGSMVDLALSAADTVVVPEDGSR